MNESAHDLADCLNGFGVVCKGLGNGQEVVPLTGGGDEDCAVQLHKHHGLSLAQNVMPAPTMLLGDLAVTVFECACSRCCAWIASLRCRLCGISASAIASVAIGDCGVYRTSSAGAKFPVGLLQFFLVCSCSAVSAADASAPDVVRGEKGRWRAMRDRPEGVVRRIMAGGHFS